jgi:hypothetical protein
MKRSRSPQTLAIRGFEQHPDKLLSVNQAVELGAMIRSVEREYEVQD